MENNKRFFHGRFISIDIDKILSIHENVYNQEPSFFLYMTGVNEKVALCKDDYEELCNILCKITDDIENIVATDDEYIDNSSDSSNVGKLYNLQIF
jgi:hypothetical protein